MKARKPEVVETQLFAFPINVNAVLAHLRQDMRDDWFPDPLLYKDLFDRPKDLEQLMSSMLFEGNGQYVPAKRVARDIPKSGYGLRYALETDFYDRFVLQAICTYLLPYYDPLLSNRVLGHRFNPERTKEKYIFKNRIDLWNTFQGITRASLNRGKHVLCTDLINYFENIQIEQIISALNDNLPQVKASGIEKAKIRNAIATLKYMLQSWCYSDRHGLPQNRDASSFFANVALNAVDQAMVGLGYDYYRYVDDIRMVFDNEAQAKRGLVDLIRELRKVGLNINSSKTQILTLNSDKEILASFFPSYDDRTTAIDNMWRSRNRRIIGRSVRYLHELLLDLINKRETQSRQFRFCINRLRTLVDANIFDCRSILTAEVQDAIFTLLTTQPVSTDQACRILEHAPEDAPIFSKIEGFLLTEELAIHGWQNYLLWLLLAYKKHVSAPLVALAKSRHLRNPERAELPAQLVYLAATGESEHLINLIDDYADNWPYQAGRLFLISLVGSDESAIKPLAKKLSAKMQGTIRRIKSNSELEGGMFYREPSSIGELHDRISPYD